jgi:hypothetical protein
MPRAAPGAIAPPRPAPAAIAAAEQHAGPLDGGTVLVLVQNTGGCRAGWRSSGGPAMRSFAPIRPHVFSLYFCQFIRKEA